MSTAGDELLRLREELDVADTAAPELDVVAFNRYGAVALVRVDPALHGVNIGDGGEIEIFAPDEGRQVLQEVFAGLDVARHDARLDQGGALPVLAEALVVREPRVGRERDLCRPGVG